MRCRTTAVVLSLVLLGSGSVDAAEAPERPIVFSDGRLSMNVKGMPLSEVLDRISRLSGVRVRFDESAASQTREELTTVMFSGLSLEEGLRRVLRGKDVVFAYSARGIDEIRVYGERAPRPHDTPPAAATPTDPRVRITDAMARAADARRADDLAHMAQLRRDAVAHPDPRRRLAALERVVASADDRTSAETLIQVIERESDRTVVERALDISGDQRAFPLEPLLRLVTSRRESSVRSKALERMIQHHGNDPRAQEALRALLNDPTAGISRTAQRLLEGLK